MVLGSGGHARVLIEALLAAGKVNPYGILDPQQDLWGEEIFGVPVLGNDQALPELIKDAEIEYFIVGVGSVGDPSVRKKLFNIASSLGLKPLTVIHPSSIISSSAEIGAGCQIMAGAIVNSGARLGRNVIINTRAVVEHDCVIGDHVHIATGAILAGNVIVEEGCHIGAGAAIRQSVIIEKNALVGIGAAVVKRVSANTVVAGVPARPLSKNH